MYVCVYIHTYTNIIYKLWSLSARRDARHSLRLRAAVRAVRSTAAPYWRIDIYRYIFRYTYVQIDIFIYICTYIYQSIYLSIYLYMYTYMDT